MKYKNIVEGIFIERPNRFVAKVEIQGEVETVHVKNTGRCKELLKPNTTVFLEDFQSNMRKRKLRYSLISVIKKGFIINMDSQAPNKVVDEGLKSNAIKLSGMDELVLIRREKQFKKSRFDFYIEDCKGEKAFIEVKGVTLENDGAVLFPDAPTERGLKHVKELEQVIEEGMRAYIIFVIQMKDVKYFSPNYEAQEAFGEALKDAEKKGVEIYAYDCRVSEDEIVLNRQVEVRL